jgi:hypothetical protein
MIKKTFRKPEENKNENSKTFHRNEKSDINTTKNELENSTTLNLDLSYKESEKSYSKLNILFSPKS